MELNIRSDIVSFASLETKLLSRSSNDLEKEYDEVTRKLSQLLTILEDYRHKWDRHCDSGPDPDDDFCAVLGKVIKKINKKVSSYTHLQSVIKDCLVKRSFEELDND